MFSIISVTQVSQLKVQSTDSYMLILLMIRLVLEALDVGQHHTTETLEKGSVSEPVSSNLSGCFNLISPRAFHIPHPPILIKWYPYQRYQLGILQPRRVDTDHDNICATAPTVMRR